MNIAIHKIPKEIKDNIEDLREKLLLHSFLSHSPLVNNDTMVAWATDLWVTQCAWGITGELKYGEEFKDWGGVGDEYPRTPSHLKIQALELLENKDTK